MSIDRCRYTAPLLVLALRAGYETEPTSSPDCILAAAVQRLARRVAIPATRRAADTHWIVSHMSQMTTAILALSQSCRKTVSGSPSGERDWRDMVRRLR